MIDYQYNISSISFSAISTRCRWIVMVMMVTSMKFLPAQSFQKDIDSTGVAFESHLFDALRYRFNNHTDRAIKELEKAKQIKHNESILDMEFGKNYALIKNNSKANQMFMRFLKRDVKSKIYIREMLSCFENSDSKSSFINALKSTSKTNKKFIESLLWAYFYNNQYELALDLIKNNRTLLNGKTIDSIQVVSQVKNQRAKSVRTFPKPPNHKPVSSNSFLEIKEGIENFLQKKQYSQLADYLNIYKDSYPTQPLVYYALGKVFLSEKKNRNAIEEFHVALDYLIENQTLEERIYLDLSKAYKREGDLKKSQTYLKKIK